MTFRAANATDRPALLELLTQASLLTDDLPDELSTFLLAHEADTLVGAAGLDLVGDLALLRSVAVAPDFRGQYLGHTLVEGVQEAALAHDFTDIYLLTTTAAPFFEQLGYEIIDRAAVPEAIAQTRQFSSLCPDSAIVMHQKLA
ncbi:arsenic resistance N-acetyltransferase ArsN2 [Fibrella aquatilis]|uniref:GNAT family N-acetyltransferase n=1 Tax=Fibrella aquatilis TaxID=2817059 RepID=A0A939K0S7_9BACT|nr:arsenic resistance N-acetyltransferase ArsN2 [Fibrella aquatilis]MBO0934509.1 GNAT family N-acetyltransferase [Fibrella aquatilis]